jgi:hypothetical protein
MEFTCERALALLLVAVGVHGRRVDAHAVQHVGHHVARVLARDEDQNQLPRLFELKGEGEGIGKARTDRRTDRDRQAGHTSVDYRIWKGKGFRKGRDWRETDRETEKQIETERERNHAD